MTNLSTSDGFASTDRKPTMQTKNLETTLATFTDNQWYCYQARQTVFFTAFSQEPVGMNDLKQMAANLCNLAPQLSDCFSPAGATREMSQEVLAEITSLEQVETLENYPENWNMAGTEIFDNPDLPMFRVKAVVLPDGPDNKGRRSAILILSIHALFEGADSALLSRSKSVEREAKVEKPAPKSFWHRIYFTALAAILTPLQLLGAWILAPRASDVGYRAFSVERAKLRRIAARLNMSQRNLMFAVSTFVLNDNGKGFSRRKISTMYADLNLASDVQTNDSFFQFRMIGVKFPVSNEFETFAKTVDTQIARAEARDLSATQSLLNAMFAMHRRFYAILPFLYSDRIYRFNAGYHLTLSLVPPQRLGGELTGQLMEPIYCGTFHPGFNMCVFAPGREHMTFNFSLYSRHLPKVEKIKQLLDQLDQ
ncbi:hypothetical protein MNBD_ALPHA12-917 [hydrothermal vent metagenome]|uniref:Condensation domain-containing protein n=1 Tax=hydrothermal vent metagenome TaxID=652676 RepID=A0A3B0TFQ9_9ZZZZ